MLDRLVPEPGAIYLMDRAYLDFERLYRIHCEGAFFLRPQKEPARHPRRYRDPVTDRRLIGCDQTVMLTREVAAPTIQGHCDACVCAIQTTALPSAVDQSFVYLQSPSARCTASLADRDFLQWIKQHLLIKQFLALRRKPSSRKCGSLSRSMC